jgi:glycosyltransferase involved in cell wall biosynthesis
MRLVWVWLISIPFILALPLLKGSAPGEPSEEPHSATSPGTTLLKIRDVLAPATRRVGRNPSAIERLRSRLKKGCPRRKYKLGILSTYPPTVCGIAQFTRNMASALRKIDARIDIEVFDVVRVPCAQRARSVNGIKIRSVVCRPETEAEELSSLAKYARQHKFDCVIVNHEYYLISSFRSYEQLLRGLSGLKTITIVHTPVSYPSSTQRSHIRTIARLSSRVLVMSWKAAHYLRFSYGVPKRKIFYFPHGITRAKTNSIHLRRLKIPRNRFMMYTDGIMHRDKGIEKIVDAMRILKERGKLGDILLVVAGVESRGSRYMAGILERVEMADLSRNFMWINKFLSASEMATLHKRADVYLALFNETIPTSGTLTYAMFMQGTVISTPYRYALELLEIDGSRKSGSLPEGIVPLRQGKIRYSNLGVVVPFSSPGALASAIERLVANREFLAGLGRSAGVRVKAYSWTNVARHLVYFLRFGKYVPVNSNPYRPLLQESVCRWEGGSPVAFNGVAIPALDNGMYRLYLDPFVHIAGTIQNNTIVDLAVTKGKSGFGKVLAGARGGMITVTKGTSRLVVEKARSIKISRRDNAIRIRTPNIEFDVHIPERGSIDLYVRKENMYGCAFGVLGSTLRKKYDLVPHVGIPLDKWKIC